MEKPPYRALVAHYDACFAAHGATPKGVDWPKDADMPARHRAMLEVVRPEHQKHCTLLDLGCGYGALKEFLGEHSIGYDYRGIDLSEPMIAYAKKRHPGTSFEVRDILWEPLTENSVDYVVMNGVFTEKGALSFERMEAFACELITAAFRAARRGVACNVMNHHADFYREDLFYWPFDRAAAFIKARLSRDYQFRADYGLYEYTMYIYKAENP